MSPLKKVLCVVSVQSGHGFLLQVQAVGATAVGICTTANNFGELVVALQAVGIQVLGWRFPSTMQATASDQAQHVVKLMEAALDGFIVDPQGDHRTFLNWDQPGLDDLAQTFCSIIRSAFPGKLLGTTCDRRAKRVYPICRGAPFISNS